MERHQQENKNGKPMVVTSVQDPSFAPSTIRRRPANPQASAETRPSRDGQTLRLARGNVTPSPESSDDELILGWSPAKPTTSKKRVITAAQKPKSPPKPKQMKQKPKASSKTTAVRTQSRNKDDALEEDDSPDIGLEALIREKQPRNTSNKKQPPSTDVKKGRMQGARGNSKSVDVIEELSDSPDLGDMSQDEGRDRVRAMPLKPRPFPMDLSSPIRKHAQPGTLSLTTNSASPPGSRGETVSKVATTDLHASSESEPDYLNMSYTQAVRVEEVDPDLLCPFCDDLLPDPLSPGLASALERLRRTAESQPRFGNAKGLKTSVDIYISFCSRHDVEAHELPKGKEYGWPMQINTLELAKRIRRLKSRLQAIIDDPDEGTFFRPLQASAKQYGKNSITGAKGAWVTFENAGTGYYGEQGLAIITQVLFDLFPDVPAEKIYPLEMSNYLSLVLVPETALLLIQDDLQKRSPDESITRPEALKVLRDSTKYGLAMFPIQDGEGEIAGDAIARERASRMRLQRAMEQRRQSGLAFADVIVELSSSEEESPVPKHATGPRQPNKSSSQVSVEDNSGKKRRMQEQDLTWRKKPSPPHLPQRRPGQKIKLQPQAASFGSSSSNGNIQNYEWLISPKNDSKGAPTS